MALFVTPELNGQEQGVLAATGVLLKKHGGSSIHHRWQGLLRRVAIARAVRGSNSIEGYRVTVDDALAAGAGEEPLEAAGETWRAITGYQSAMTYVIQKSEEVEPFSISTDLIKSLHFMMIQFDLSKRPGRWRDGPTNVVDEERNEIVYRGPDFELVPGLIDELVGELNGDADCPAIVKAAMAHLNLTMIHPFKDGNGRMARCLQTLVLARDKITNPIYASIEEYLGRNTLAYYEVLAKVGAGSWHPERDARPWIRFCLTAHYRQAQTLEYRTKALQNLWNELEHLLGIQKLPSRALVAIAEAAMGFRVRNSTYRSAADISFAVATKDLKALADSGLLEPRGQKRGRFYVASPSIFALGEGYRNPPKVSDPFSMESLPSGASSGP